MPMGERHFHELYTWYASEKHMERYTCRPTGSIVSEDKYSVKIKGVLGSPSGSCYVLVASDDSDKPLGKIRSFDYNPRNHSAEFGYYLPEHNRHKGMGTVMLRLFVDLSFADDRYDLNKLYATTSSDNTPSIRLLEKYGFRLDGRQREHCWIDGNRYDQLIYSILRSEWPVRR